MPLIFSKDALKQIDIQVKKILNSLKTAQIHIQLNNAKLLKKVDKVIFEPFLDELLNDLNIANAQTILQYWSKEINTLVKTSLDETKLLRLQNLESVTARALKILNIDFVPIKLTKQAKDLFSEFNKAYEQKDYATSDILRAKLAKKGLL
jgi:cysteinyl-tRNA synthetase